MLELIIKNGTFGIDELKGFGLDIEDSEMVANEIQTGLLNYTLHNHIDKNDMLKGRAVLDDISEMTSLEFKDFINQLDKGHFTMVEKRYGDYNRNMQSLAEQLITYKI